MMFCYEQIFIQKRNGIIAIIYVQRCNENTKHVQVNAKLDKFVENVEVFEQ